MFLRELRVENLRAIESAAVQLDATTVLIGENDSGVSGLLAALELALGGAEDARVSAQDFHRAADRTADELRIALVFEERSAGEWASAEHAQLVGHLPRAGKGKRQLVLETSARRVDSGKASSPLIRRVVGARDAAHERELVRRVRQLSPLIRVCGGEIAGHGESEPQRETRRVDTTRLDRETATLVNRVLKASEQLLRERGVDVEARLDDGYRAASELLAKRPQHFDSGAGGLTQSVLEILGQQPARKSPARGRDTKHGAPSVAERLGVLLLVAAVLRRIPAGIERGAEPLWVIEAPEAHLHPMTLASVARLLERIDWQKIVTTHSADFLSRMPLRQIRRLVRHGGHVRSHGVQAKALSRADLQRVGHHLRARRGVAMFARVWLLVEGESEFWILPQIAHVLGLDLDVAGVACVEFAQAGLEPLLRTAREFGIEWHVLADGDEAGHSYAVCVRRFLARGEGVERITLLQDRDIEHCLWRHGHADVLRKAAQLQGAGLGHIPAGRVIRRALKLNSKPGLAMMMIESIARRGAPGVPAPLRRLIETCLALARRAS